MKRSLTIVIALAFLASGLIRLGVSALMIGQAQGWWLFDGEAVEALAETQAFVANAKVNLIGFSVPAYFAYIGVMGLVVCAGAIGAILRRRWGLAWLAAYIAMHGALFVNFWTINPKIGFVLLAAAALAVLAWANGEPRKQPAA